MHSNIAQLSLIWVAKTILTGVAYLPDIPLDSSSLPLLPPHMTVASVARDLLNWNTPSTNIAPSALPAVTTSQINHELISPPGRPKSNGVVTRRRRGRPVTLGEFLTPKYHLSSPCANPPRHTIPRPGLHGVPPWYWFSY
jgi:hypothetical protein